MWYLSLQTPKINLSVLFRKWEVSYWMEKKANVVSVHKKGEKQILKNRPISLLPAARKTFEWLLYDSIFEF